MSDGARGSADWNALAPHWRHFEHGGLTARSLSSIEAAIRAPCLYVGAGLGTVPARIAARLGAANVTLADASVAMLARAAGCDPARRLGCDVRALPVRDGAFATVVCATGVLEPMGSTDRIVAMRELGRACAASAAALVAVQLDVGATLIDAWADLDAWLTAPTRTAPRWAPFDAVAADLGSRAAAHALLRRTLPRFPLLTTAEAIASAVRDAGLAIGGRLDVGGGVAVFRVTR